MSVKIEPNTAYPFTVSNLDSTSKEPDYIYIADWCHVHVGKMDQCWTMRWDDTRGMVFAFTNKNDAGFFNWVWV